jgi:hypothetical protein
MAHLLGLTLVEVLALLVGLMIGGWVWAVAGKLFFGLTRSDIEGLFRIGPQIEIVTRYNNWCLDIVFGPGEDRDSSPS